MSAIFCWRFGGGEGVRWAWSSAGDIGGRFANRGVVVTEGRDDAIACAGSAWVMACETEICYELAFLGCCDVSVGLESGAYSIV